MIKWKDIKTMSKVFAKNRSF